MRRSLFLALLLLVAPAAAHALDFGTLNVEKGYGGPVALDLKWSDGTPRNVSGATATLKVYSVKPVNGAGGIVLKTITFTPAGTPTNRLSATLLTTDFSVPSSTPYAAELSIAQSGVTDTAHGYVNVTGY